MSQPSAQNTDPSSRGGGVGGGGGESKKVHQRAVVEALKKRHGLHIAPHFVRSYEQTHGEGHPESGAFLRALFHAACEERLSQIGEPFLKAVLEGEDEANEEKEKKSSKQQGKKQGKKKKKKQKKDKDANDFDGNGRLTGTHVLQIYQTRDLNRSLGEQNLLKTGNSKRRMQFFFLSDGKFKVKAVEIGHIPLLDNKQILPGEKIQLRNPPMQGGVLLLRKENVVWLGGGVRDFAERFLAGVRTREHDRRIFEKHFRKNETPPPPFEALDLHAVRNFDPHERIHTGRRSQPYSLEQAYDELLEEVKAQQEQEAKADGEGAEEEEKRAPRRPVDFDPLGYNDDELVGVPIAQRQRQEREESNVDADPEDAEEEKAEALPEASPPRILQRESPQPEPQPEPQRHGRPQDQEAETRQVRRAEDRSGRGRGRGRGAGGRPRYEGSPEEYGRPYERRERAARRDRGGRGRVESRGRGVHRDDQDFYDRGGGGRGRGRGGSSQGRGRNARGNERRGGEGEVRGRGARGRGRGRGRGSSPSPDQGFPQAGGGFHRPIHVQATSYQRQRREERQRQERDQDQQQYRQGYGGQGHGHGHGYQQVEEEEGYYYEQQQMQQPLGRGQQGRNGRSERRRVRSPHQIEYENDNRRRPGTAGSGGGQRSRKGGSPAAPAAPGSAHGSQNGSQQGGRSSRNSPEVPPAASSQKPKWSLMSLCSSAQFPVRAEVVVTVSQVLFAFDERGSPCGVQFELYDNTATCQAISTDALFTFLRRKYGGPDPNPATTHMAAYWNFLLQRLQRSFCTFHARVDIELASIASRPTVHQVRYLQ